MKNKTIVLVLFALIMAVQLYVPAKMILDNEEILENGKEFKFRTQPIDPNDPFRGKFVRLYIEEDHIVKDSTEEWNDSKNVFVLIEEDSLGFARIKDIAETQPASGDYIYTKVYSSYINDAGRYISVDYPFDRYYMEESKAFEAETAYRESNIDSTQVTYVLVSVKEGNAVLKDVLINEESIRDVVLRQRIENMNSAD